MRLSAADFPTPPFTASEDGLNSIFLISETLTIVKPTALVGWAKRLREFWDA